MNTKQYKNHFSKRHLNLTSFSFHFDPQNPPKTLPKSIQNPYKTLQIHSHHITSCHMSSHHITSQHITKCHEMSRRGFSQPWPGAQWPPLPLSRRNPRWPPNPPSWTQDDPKTPQLRAKMPPRPPTSTQDSPK